MAVTLPDDVPDEVRGLGEPVALFQTGAVQFVLFVVVGTLALLLGAGMLVLVVTLMLNPARAKNGRGHGPGLVRGIGLGLVLLAAGVGMLIRARRTRGLRVFIFPAGLARLQGGAAEVLRWDEINRVRRVPGARKGEFSVRRPYQFILVRRDGREFEFNEALVGVKELRVLIEEHTLPHMLPPAVEAFRAGEAVGFGAVGLSREGIHHGKRLLPWDAFAGALAAKGRLTVRAQGAWMSFCRVGIAEVTNPHVFLALAEYGRRERP
jgi:hypothetical protein